MHPLPLAQPATPERPKDGCFFIMFWMMRLFGLFLIYLGLSSGWTDLQLLQFGHRLTVPISNHYTESTESGVPVAQSVSDGQPTKSSNQTTYRPELQYQLKQQTFSLRSLRAFPLPQPPINTPVEIVYLKATPEVAKFRWDIGSYWGYGFIMATGFLFLIIPTLVKLAARYLARKSTKHVQDSPSGSLTSPKEIP